ALVADCRAYVLEAQGCPNAASIPGQAYLNMSIFWNNGVLGQTGYDFYRHGKAPQLANSQQFNATGGKVAFNILYADGHVKTASTLEEGYMAARMRFPG